MISAFNDVYFPVVLMAVRPLGQTIDIYNTGRGADDYKICKLPRLMRRPEAPSTPTHGHYRASRPMMPQLASLSASLGAMMRQAGRRLTTIGRFYWPPYSA